MQIPSGKFYKTKGATDQPVDVDVEQHQMPKRSRKFDISRSMMGGKPAKHAKTEKKATDTEIDIKSAGETPEDLKKTIVAQLIKEGKVRRTRSYDFSK